MVNISRTPASRDRVLSTTAPTVRLSDHKKRYPLQGNPTLNTFKPTATLSNKKLYTAGMTVTSAPGSGDATLDVAVPNRPSFVEDGIVNDQRVSYVAYDDQYDEDGQYIDGEYEFGTGVYTKVGSVEKLTQRTVEKSTTGQLIDLSASATIYMNPDHYASPLEVNKVVAVETAARVAAIAAQRLVQPVPAAKSVSTTLTVAELLTRIITVDQNAGGTSNLQLPLASAMDTALPDAVVDDAFDFSLINVSTSSSEPANITTNTNWTLVGGMGVAANSSTTTRSVGRFRARKTGVGTWTLYRIS